MLTLSHKTFDTYKEGSTSALLLTSFEGMYSSLRESMGKVWVLFLVYTLLWPFVLVVTLVLKNQRRRMLLHMKNRQPKLGTVEDYVKFKQNLDSSDEFNARLQKVGSYNPDSAHFVVRFALTQMQKVADTLLTFNGWMHSRLDEAMNKSKFNAPKNLVLKTEKELWNERSKAYDYWM